MSEEEVAKVHDLLNGRPRKVLDWDTPYLAMAKLLRQKLETKFYYAKYAKYDAEDLSTDTDKLWLSINLTF